jgi:hypothetical protein
LSRWEPVPESSCVKELLRELNVERGDTLHLVRNESGDHVLTPLDPEALEQVEAVAA